MPDDRAGDAISGWISRELGHRGALHRSGSQDWPLDEIELGARVAYALQEENRRGSAPTPRRSLGYNCAWNTRAGSS